MFDLSCAVEVFFVFRTAGLQHKGTAAHPPSSPEEEGRARRSAFEKDR